MLRTIIIALLAAGLGACSTSLGGGGFGVGGGDPTAVSKVSADTYRIPGAATAAASQSAVQDDVLLKAAQTTKEAGATHFIVLASSESAATATPIGNRPKGAEAGGRPAQDVLIRVLTVAPGAQAPIGALSADETIAFVGRKKR